MHHPSNHQKKGVFPGFHNYILHVKPNVRPEKNKCGKSKITIYAVISFYLSQYLLDVEVSQIHVHFL